MFEILTSRYLTNDVVSFEQPNPQVNKISDVI